MISNAFFVLNCPRLLTGIMGSFYVPIVGTPRMLMNLKAGCERQIYAPAVMESSQADFDATPQLFL